MSQRLRPCGSLCQHGENEPLTPSPWVKIEDMITKMIEPIKAYSVGHLILCLGLVLFAVPAVSLLRKSKKQRVIVCFGIALAVIEVLKQLIMNQIFESYSWSDIPFQLCSVPMYLCLLYPFIKKCRRTFELFLGSFGMLGAIVAFAIPYDVFSGYLFLSIQSIVWHELLLILGLYCVVVLNKKEEPGVKDFRNNATLYLILALIAIGINALLWGKSSGTANMFFLGPSKPCVMILDDIYEKCGWGVESIVMICCSEAAGALILLVVRLVKKIG